MSRRSRTSVWLCGPSRRAHVSVTNQTAYVRDYELTILPGLDEEIVDPVIDVAPDGTDHAVAQCALG